MAGPTINGPLSVVKTAVSEPSADLKQQHRDSSNAIVAKYNAWTVDHDYRRLKYLRELYTHCPQLADRHAAPTVLELGCGAGLPVLQNLLSHNLSLKVIANDISDGQIALARSNLTPHANSIDRVSFVLRDMLGVKCKTESLTAAVGLYSLIHLPRGEQLEMLRRIARWLVPGGYLLANFDAEEKEGEVTDQWLGEEQGWKYVSSFGAERVLGILGEVGLKVEKTAIHADPLGDFIWVIARKG